MKLNLRININYVPNVRQIENLKIWKFLTLNGTGAIANPPVNTLVSLPPQ